MKLSTNESRVSLELNQWEWEHELWSNMMVGYDVFETFSDSLKLVRTITVNYWSNFRPGLTCPALRNIMLFYWLRVETIPKTFINKSKTECLHFPSGQWETECWYFRYRVPKAIAMVITSLQLVQMIIGCVVNYMAFNYKQNGQFYNRNNNAAILTGFSLVRTPVRSERHQPKAVSPDVLQLLRALRQVLLQRLRQQVWTETTLRQTPRWGQENYPGEIRSDQKSWLNY